MTVGSQWVAPISMRLPSVGAGADGAGTEATVELDLETPPFLGFLAREAEERLSAGLPGALDRLRVLIEDEPA